MEGMLLQCEHQWVGNWFEWSFVQYDVVLYCMIDTSMIQCDCPSLVANENVCHVAELLLHTK